MALQVAETRCDLSSTSCNGSMISQTGSYRNVEALLEAPVAEILNTSLSECIVPQALNITESCRCSASPQSTYIE